MDLNHSFTVPAPIEVTWEAFNDIESVAECFPGATVTAVDGDEFKGSCKVKLGPIALVYNGTGKFLEKDEAAHRFVVEAKGKDKRGNGTAGATVTASFSSPTPDSTEVSVVTDLAITGKPAQFGRGVMQDVSDKLLQAFVDCLKSKVGSSGAPVGDVELADEAPAGEAPADEAETGEPGVTAAPGRHAADPAEGVDASNGEVPWAGSGARDNDTLDLGATVLPILLKSYWKQVLGAIVVLLVLKKLLGRRCRNQTASVLRNR